VVTAETGSRKSETGNQKAEIGKRLLFGRRAVFLLLFPLLLSFVLFALW